MVNHAAATAGVPPTIVPGSAPTILVVDDDLSSSMILTAILEQDGYQIITASNGEEAIELFGKHWPDLVIMDVLMEGIDGYETAKRIMTQAGERFIPLIFVTGIHDPELLAQCFTCGGLDYIEKPYNPTILLSKTRTFLNLAKLYRETQQQRDEVKAYNEYLKTSYEVAKGVFDKVMHSDVLDSPGIEYSLSPVAIFNGDVVMAAQRPTGELHVMLGDFVGHGVSAAIGAIPVSDIFYGMTSKGFPTGDISREIQTKLNRIMPRGLFLAGCMLEYNIDNKMLNVCNAGIPVVLLFNKATREIKYSFCTKNLPFGVVAGVASTCISDDILIEANDILLLCTDGVTETANSKREMYGIDRIYNLIKKYNDASIIDAIKHDLNQFSDAAGQKDDLTIVTIEFNRLCSRPSVQEAKVYPEPIRNSAWQMQFTFEAELLKLQDPLPSVIQMLMDVQRLHRVKQDIFIILKELYTNSLEHGLLGLESRLKQEINGFTAYYQQRQEKLATLSDGYIRLEISHHPIENGGEVVIRIRDSGSGFDTTGFTRQQSAADDSGNRFHGRGLLLVHSLCESLTFHDNGREVYARYRWQFAA